MAHTKVTKTYSQNTGAANTFSYSGSFDVFKATEVVALLDNVELTYTASTINESASPREYSVDVSAKTIHIGGADLSSGTIIMRPVTDMGAPTPRATYTPGASITSEDLNNNQKQLMRKAMEYDETKLSSTGGTMTGHLNIGEDQTIIFEGATDNAYETTLTVTDPTADRTITLPNVTGTVVTTGDTATVTATMLAANSVDSSELVDGSIDTSHIGASQVTTAKIANSNVTTAKIAADNITSALIADDQIDSEHYVDSSIDAAHIASSAVTTAKINADAVTGAKIADDAIDSEHYTDGSIDVAHMSANSVDSDQYVDGSIDRVHLAADIVDGTKIADDSINSEHIAADSIDAEHYAAGSVDATALANDSVTFVKIGCEQTTITDTDTSIPTSGAVVDYVSSAITPLGGFEAIATEDVFPTTVPAAGVIVSIADATEISVNSSGVSTNCRTDGNGSDNVTINGFPSILRGGVGSNADPYVLPASSGLLVVSTGSSHTYNYHRLIATTEDIKLLSDTVESFKARYRVASSAPGSDNTDGDIYYNTTNNTLYTYNGSAWEVSVSTTPNDDTVTGAKIVDNAIDSEHYTDGSIDTAHYAASSVDATALASNAVTTAKINADAVTGAKIADDSIDSEHYVDGSIDNAHIADDAIDSEHYAAGSIDEAHIADNQVTLAKMAGIARGKIIYGDSSGNPAVLTVGSSGQTLVSDGTDISWGAAAAGATGGGSDKVFWENAQAVTADYTITNNYNAGTFGPITINSGVTVTVGSGEYWTIV